MSFDVNEGRITKKSERFLITVDEFNNWCKTSGKNEFPSIK